MIWTGGLWKDWTGHITCDTERNHPIVEYSLCRIGMKGCESLPAPPPPSVAVSPELGVGIAVQLSMATSAAESTMRLYSRHCCRESLN